MRDEPIASVVVATHQRAAHLPGLVRALEAQEAAHSIEVIIVDDASTDDTWPTLNDLSGTSRVPVLVERLDRNSGPAAARNIGWRRAVAPLILFTDDDCLPEPGWLSAMVARLQEADIVQGRTLPDDAHDSKRGPYSRTMMVTEENGYYETCNVGYRRAMIESLGGFDERFRYPYGEDVDLAWRAREKGARTAFEPRALVLHHVWPSSYLAYVRDTKRLEGVVLVVAAHPQLRERLYRRLFFHPSHPFAVLATAGLVLCLTPSRSTARRIAALLLAVPYVRKWWTSPFAARRSLAPAMISLALVADLTEIGVLLRASVRHRCLVL